jgi:hypothetical protein
MIFAAIIAALSAVLAPAPVTLALPADAGET